MGGATGCWQGRNLLSNSAEKHGLAEPIKSEPAIAVKKSVFADHILCLNCGGMSGGCSLYRLRPLPPPEPRQTDRAGFRRCSAHPALVTSGACGSRRSRVIVSGKVWWGDRSFVASFISTVSLPFRLTPDRLRAPVVSRRTGVVNLIVLIIVLMILFGGGGFYYGGPYVGGGLGTVLLIILIVLLLRG